MASTSDLDLVNLGLGHLKQKPVSSVSPPVQTAAKIAMKYYDDAILAELRRARPWWAEDQAILSPSTEKPLFGYANVYPLPDDCVAILTIGDTEYDQYTGRKKMSKKGLMLDEEGNVPITYICQQFDVTKMDAVFRMSASFFLAELAAYELTGNGNLRAVMEEQHDKYLLEQRSINGQEQPVKRFQQSKFSRARRRSATAFSE